jgi:hypothetical protein
LPLVGPLSSWWGVGVFLLLNKPHYQRRKVFLVEPLSEAESAKFMIRVDKQAQQTPDVFNR